MVDTTTTPAAERAMRPAPRAPQGSARVGVGRVRGAAAGLTWRRGLLGAALLLVVGFAAVKGYERVRPAPKPVAPVQTAAAAKRSIVESVALPGTAATGRQAKLSFSASGAGVSVSGTVRSVSVKTGDNVKQGQEIARLDTTSLDYTVQSAQSALTVAQLKQQQLLDGALPADLASAAQSVISASGAALTAQNSLTNAQLALDAIQRQANLSAQSATAQQAAERATTSAVAAQREVDAAMAQMAAAGADSFTTRALESAIADLLGAVRTRCATLTTRDGCATVAQAAGDLTALVTGLNQQTIGPQDLTPSLTAFNDAASRMTVPTLRPAMFRWVQATASHPGLAASANNLAFTQSGSAGSPTPETLANAIRARDAATAALEAAHTGYDVAVARRVQVVAGPLPVEILLQQQSVAQANLALQKAMNEQKGAVLFAPFDGVVGTITINAGELSGSGAIILIDPNAMQLQAAAQEADISKIRVGQPATLAFDAYAGTTLPGVVLSVAPDATVTQGVAAYAVVIGVSAQSAPGTAPGTGPGSGQGGPRGAGQGNGQDGGAQGGRAQGAQQGGAQGAPRGGGQGAPSGGAPAAQPAGAPSQPAAAGIVLRPGMTGTGNVEIQRHNDVLAVPSKAVKRQGRTSVVTVMTADGKQEARTVQTGASDASYVQIVAGLQEGDLVVLPTVATSTTTTSTAAPLPGSGGGGGGGPPPGFRPGG